MLFICIFFLKTDSYLVKQIWIWKSIGPGNSFVGLSIGIGLSAFIFTQMGRYELQHNRCLKHKNRKSDSLITEGFVIPSGWSRPNNSWFLAANLLSSSSSGGSCLWEQALGSSSSPPGQCRTPSQTRYEAMHRLVTPHTNWESLLQIAPEIVMRVSYYFVSTVFRIREKIKSKSHFLQ